MSIVDDARNIAIEFHGGDRNKHDGEMYILHLSRVYQNVREAGGDRCQEAIAWLHDSIEDTTLDIETLTKRLIGVHERKLYSMDLINEVVTAVDVLTKIKGESNDSYYMRVRLNENACFVKLEGDIKDNVRRNWKIIDPVVRERMMTKYSKGIDMLSGAWPPF